MENVMDKMEEKFGSVEFEGGKYILIQDVYLDGVVGSAAYFANAVKAEDEPDEDGYVPIYKVKWEMDEGGRCDWWGSPADVRKIGAKFNLNDGSEKKIALRNGERKMNTNFLYLHCDEHKSVNSIDACCDNYLYSGNAGRKALWRAIKKDIEDGAIEVSGIPIPRLRLMILIGNPEEANDYIKYAFILGLEKVI